MRRRRAVRSGRPPSGSIGPPPASGSAIALTVKSRRARSASSEPPRNGSTSTCHEESRAATRHAPKVSDRAKQAARPAACAIAAAASPGSPSTTTSTSAVGRPSSAVADRAAHQPGRPAGQRGAGRLQALTHAGPASTAGCDARSRPGLPDRHAVAVVDARHARREHAGDLVVDRVQAPRDLLGGDPLVALEADQDRRLAAQPRSALGSPPRSTVTLSMLTVPTSG